MPKPPKINSDESNTTHMKKAETLLSTVASKVQDGVEPEKAIKQAEKETGISIRKIKSLSNVSQTLQRTIAEHYLSDELGKAALVSRLYELLLDEDPKVSVQAAGQLKGILGMDQPRGGPTGPQVGAVVIIQGPEAQALRQETQEYKESIIDVSPEAEEGSEGD